MGLIEDVGSGPVGLDTAIFIYCIEEHPRFLPVVEPLFVAIDAGPLEGVRSALTLLPLADGAALQAAGHDVIGARLWRGGRRERRGGGRGPTREWGREDFPLTRKKRPGPLAHYFGTSGIPEVEERG